MTDTYQQGMSGKKGLSNAEGEEDTDSQRPSKRPRVGDHHDTREASTTHASVDQTNPTNDDWDEDEMGGGEAEPARASDLYLDTVSNSTLYLHFKPSNDLVVIDQQSRPRF